MTYEEVQQIKKEFEDFLTEEQRKYISGIGISLVRILDPTTDLSALREPCILVGTLQTLPPEIQPPSEFKGVRVFYRPMDRPVPY